MEYLIIILTVSIPFFCLFSFRTGFKYGFIGREKPEAVAPKSPVKKIKTDIEKSKQNKRRNAILRNIDNYGTGKQEDVK